MSSKEFQELMDRMLAAKRRGKAMYTADRLHLEGWRQGFEEGFMRVCRTKLLRLLHLRFGDAASHVGGKIQCATLDQLNLWHDRAALAATLDDVFRADERSTRPDTAP